MSSPLELFLVCIAFAFVVNWLAYVPAFLGQTEKYFDLMGGVTYVSVVLMAWLLHPDGVDARGYLLGGLIIAWAARLSVFLFLRVQRTGHDSRFEKIKRSWSQFLMTWTIQGLWVSMTAACALAAITLSPEVPLGPFAICGALIWLAGMAFEVVADAQKSRFKADPANEGRFIDEGLWRWCRHPNYFGEIVLWTGISVIALPTLSGWWYLTLISPVFVWFLLTKISGVRLQNGQARRRWGNDEAYQSYRASTPKLIPRPPRR